MKGFVILALVAAFQFALGDFINGGFEDDCASFDYCLSATSLTGWTMTAGSVDIVSNNYWPSHSGQWSIDMDGSTSQNAAVTMSQSFCTTVGTSYTVTFFISYNTDIPVGQTSSMSVTADGNPSQSYTVTHQSGDGRTAYHQQTYTFTATQTTTAITFASLNPGDFGPILDDVSISGNPGNAPCSAPPQTPDQFCNGVDQSQWTYGQGYYCWNNNVGFIQCWGSNPTYSAYQNCALGTSCVCASSSQECSNHGTMSPCQ